MFKKPKRRFDQTEREADLIGEISPWHFAVGGEPKGEPSKTGVIYLVSH